MFERIERLYKTGKLSEAGVKNAVAKGWITKNQMEEILSK